MNPTHFETIDGEQYERHGLEVKAGRTNRGFGVFEFQDFNGEVCSLQDSSLATESAIWLGPDDPWPKAFYPHGVKNADHGVWEELPRELPEGAEYFMCSGRMHLSLDQVKVLLPILQHFVEHGVLPKEAVT